MKLFFKQNPALSYFLLTFVMSWGGLIIVSLFMGMPVTSREFEEFGPIALPPCLLGPTLASVFLTGMVKGKIGLRELKTRFLKWKVGIKWYAFGILLVPLILVVMLSILSRFSPDFIPKVLNEKDKLDFIITGILVGILGGGLFEEIGWTGFATHELLKKYSIFKTGMIIGFFWALWHFLPVFWGSGDANGNIDWSLFLPGLFGHYTVLLTYRILIVWLYAHVNSLLPVILMHASLTTFVNFILNISVGGLPLFIYYCGLSLSLWITVFIVFKGQRKLADNT